MEIDLLSKIIHFKNMLSLVQQNTHGIERPLWDLLNLEESRAKFFDCCQNGKPLGDVVKPLFEDHFGNHHKRTKGEHWLPGMVLGIMERYGYEMVPEGEETDRLGKYARSAEAESIIKSFDEVILKWKRSESERK